MRTKLDIYIFIIHTSLHLSSSYKKSSCNIPKKPSDLKLKDKQKQWPKEKGQTTIYKNTIHKTTKTGCELRCSGMVNSSCSTCDTRRPTFEVRDKSKLRDQSFYLI